MTIANIDDGEAGSSVRAKLNLVIDDVNGVVQNITASAVSPGPDINVLADIVYVTSAGSAGAEYVNMPPGNADPTQMGHVVRVVCLAPTDPADVVHVLLLGSGDFAPLSPVGATYPPGSTILGYRVANGVELKYEDDGTAFTRGYGTFYWTPWITGFSDEQVSHSSPIVIKTIDQPAGSGLAGESITLQAGAGDTDQSGGPVSITAGNGGGSDSGSGGGINVTAGNGAFGHDAFGGAIAIVSGAGAAGSGSVSIQSANSSAGQAGNVTIQVGTSGGANPGNIVMPTLPIADPLVAGALWNNAGVLSVSAGPPP